MSLFIGRTMSVGVATETVRGVGVAPTFWVNAKTFSFIDAPERALSEAGFGRITGGDQAPKTMEKAEGEVEFEMDDQSLGIFLKSVFGTVNTVTTDTSAFTHTFSLQNDNQHDSMSIHTIDPIGQLLFELSMIDTFEILIEPDNIVSARVGFMSKGSADSSGQTASYVAVKKWIGRNLTFKVAENTAGLGAASAVSLKSLTLRIEKNAEINKTLGTVQPEDIVNKKFNVTGEIVLDYEDRTFLNFVKDATNRAMRIDLVHEDLAGASTAFFQFKIDLSKVMFDDFSPDFALDEIVTQTYTFTGLYDVGGNDNVVNDCILVNQIASY